MNYINTDSFGNSYLNGFSNALPGPSFYSFNDSETGGVVNFFSNVYTSNQFWTGLNMSLNFMLPSSKEGNTPNGILRRFLFDEQNDASPANGGINTIYSGSESFVRLSGSTLHPLYVKSDLSLDASSSYRTFSVCNNESISVFKRTSATFGTNVNTGFISLGWLDDAPVFTQNSPYRTGTAYILYAQCGDPFNGGIPNAITIAYRAGSEGGVVQQLLTSGDANYAVTCQSGGPPGATWATNLVLIDTTASPANYAMGSVRNVLLGKGTYTVGTVYKVTGVGYGEANTSPNTEQQHFVCVGTWGTDYLLMRVWTEGYQ